MNRSGQQVGEASVKRRPCEGCLCFRKPPPVKNKEDGAVVDCMDCRAGVELHWRVEMY